MAETKILINRAPVLTLWAAVVAERLGFKPDEALSLGKALAGLNAQSKGRRLGIFKPSPKELKKVREQKRGEEFWVDLLGRALAAVNTEEGVRAVVKANPIEPEGVERYLESKFGDALLEVRKAMTELANALKPDELAQGIWPLRAVPACDPKRCTRVGGKRGTGLEPHSEAAVTADSVSESTTPDFVVAWRGRLTRGRARSSCLTRSKEVR